MTVVGYDVTDLYVETLVFQGQTPVGISFKGNTVPFIVVPQTYKFRTATGLASVTNPTPVLVAPPHGPVISLDAAHGIAITRAVDRAGEPERRPARLLPPEQRGQRGRRPPGARG